MPAPSPCRPCASYKRRRPELTALDVIVRENLETFLEHVREERGKALPRYTVVELRRYCRCGILAHGFLRVACSACGHENVVGYSCKCRGACPSCSARRMCDVAVHLVDAERTIRQLTDERRGLFRRAGEADALREDRERLRAEVESLSREVETLRHRRDLGLAAVPDVTVSLEPRSQPEPPPPRRWEACRDLRICTVRHFEALEYAARCRSDWEQRISCLEKAGAKGWFTHDAKVLVDYARRARSVPRP